MSLLYMLLFFYYLAYICFFVADVCSYNDKHGTIGITKKGWLLGLIPFYTIWYMIYLWLGGVRKYWRDLD